MINTHRIRELVGSGLIVIMLCLSLGAQTNGAGARLELISTASDQMVQGLSNSSGARLDLAGAESVSAESTNTTGALLRIGIFHISMASLTVEMIANHLLGLATLSGEMLQRADVNGDGLVDVSDVIYLQNKQ